MEKHYCYCLISKDYTTYIGVTSRLKNRIHEHNRGKTMSTKDRKWEYLFQIGPLNNRKQIERLEFDLTYCPLNRRHGILSLLPDRMTTLRYIFGKTKSLVCINWFNEDVLQCYLNYCWDSPNIKHYINGKAYPFSQSIKNTIQARYIRAEIDSYSILKLKPQLNEDKQYAYCHMWHPDRIVKHPCVQNIKQFDIDKYIDGKQEYFACKMLFAISGFDIIEHAQDIKKKIAIRMRKNKKHRYDIIIWVLKEYDTLVPNHPYLTIHIKDDGEKQKIIEGVKDIRNISYTFME